MMHGSSHGLPMATQPRFPLMKFAPAAISWSLMPRTELISAQWPTGGTGPFRVIIRDDAFGTRGTKHLIEIEIEAG